MGEQNGEVDWVHLPGGIYTHFVLEGKVRSRDSGDSKVVVSIKGLKR